MKKSLVWAGIVALLAAARLCYLRVLWVEEAYPTAAALELLRGHTLYRDIWFDKPPLFAWLYTLWGAQMGVPLRVAGVLFGVLAAWCAYRAARVFWGEKEALWAAAFTALYLVFDTPSAVMALTPDLLTVPLQFGAVALAAAGLPVWAGACAGVAVLFNAKGLLILAACLAWQWRQAHRMAAGFAVPVLAGLAVLAAQGALGDFWQQVWAWGAVYSKDTPVQHAWIEGARRTLNWSGFHLALVIGAAAASWKEEDWRWAVWIWISLAGVFLGLRFSPRYYFHLLPVMVLLGARGFALLPRKWLLFAILSLLVPVWRFGPRYVQVAQGKPWGDLILYRSSEQAAETLKTRARASDTLLVWGYRPELFPLSGLGAGTRYLDSQPLSGVIADRHLTDSTVSFRALSAANRAALLRAPRPTWIADGLGPFNATLEVGKVMPELMREYELATAVTGYKIYRWKGGH